jgi:phospholipase/carboxylesterase
LGYALSRPARIQGVLNLSGFLPVHEEVRLDGASAPPPVFWGHGLQDPSIPFTLAVSGRRRLQDAGVPLEAHDYPIGHWIDEAEIAHAATFLERLRTS